MTTVNVAIVYYSAMGNVHALAHAAAEGAEKAGARVRVRRVAETAPAAAVAANAAWERYRAEHAEVPEPVHEDLVWADAVLWGTPTRFGNPSSQLRAFIETTGPLWAQGKLAGKVYSTFTSSNTLHGGQESTILALANTFYHWGGVIVPPGYTDPVQFQTGNPYGTSHVAGAPGSQVAPSEVTLQAAAYQARRVTDVAAALKAGRAAA
ncbi:NAD(P)H:quinone oxidoreductase [Streptomyces venezuelae]